MSIADKWLERANVSDLLALACRLREGRLSRPYSGSALQLAGMDATAAHFLSSLGDTDPLVIAWILERLAAERKQASDSYADVARLVWSGASQGEPLTRDTSVVLDGLFSNAEQQVLIATYVIQDGRTVFAKLAERLRQRPNIAIELYVNLPARPRQPDDETADVAAFLKSFARDHWPEDLPLPALYYDPESRKSGTKRASLHAKCVVVDERQAFVTSANFTEAAQERNIEVGVLLKQPLLAKILAARFRSLSTTGRLKRMLPR
jgi:phosphatidylserine/phosphatidylglycerophosphate/cardiolipin synthase-like enzyme